MIMWNDHVQVYSEKWKWNPPKIPKKREEVPVDESQNLYWTPKERKDVQNLKTIKIQIFPQYSASASRSIWPSKSLGWIWDLTLE